MTDPIESLVRQALQVQADRAVDPEQVRSALPARSAQRATHHRSGLVAVGAVLAVTAAVAVPTLVARLDVTAGTGTGATGVAGAETTTGQPAGAPRTPPTVGLPYRPTWLPAGLVERGREASLGKVPAPVRIWTRNPAGSGDALGGPLLELYVTDKANLAVEGTQVTVNGRPGFIVDNNSGPKSYIIWQQEPDTALIIAQRNLELSDGDLLRIAESVRTDTAVLAVPLRIGWLPQGVELTSADTIGNSATAWRSRVLGQEQQPAESKVPSDKQPGPDLKSIAAVPPSGGTDPKKIADRRQGSGQRGIDVSVGTLATGTAGTGTPGVINGHPSRTFSKTEDGQSSTGTVTILVDLGDGRTLTVQGSGAWNPADLTRVAENVEVTELPDLSWLGTR